MKPKRIYPEYAMILKYDIRPGVHERYFRWATGVFLPALQKRNVYMQNAWLVVYGDYPERHVEFVTESLTVLHKLMDDPHWHELEDKLKSYTTNYTRRIVRYTSSFKL